MRIVLPGNSCAVAPSGIVAIKTAAKPIVNLAKTRRDSMVFPPSTARARPPIMPTGSVGGNAHRIAGAFRARCAPRWSAWARARRLFLSQREAGPDENMDNVQEKWIVAFIR